MLEFVATHSLWIAILVIVGVLVWEWKTHAAGLRERMPEVALQAAGVFLAVSLAFVQTNYDRRQQRLNDAQTLVLSAATSTIVGLEELARPVSMDYDAKLSPSWFAISPVVEKMLTDEKVLATMDFQHARDLNRHVAAMRRSYERASPIVEQEVKNAKEGKKQSWRQMTCELDRVVGEHLRAVNGVLAEACTFLTSTGQGLPDFLDRWEVVATDRDKPAFRVNQCKIEVLESPWRHQVQIDASLKGTPESCTDL